MKSSRQAKSRSKGRRIYLTLFALFVGCLAFSSMMLKLAGKIAWPYLLAGGIDCALAILLTILVDKKIPNSIKSIVPVGLLLSLMFHHADSWLPDFCPVGHDSCNVACHMGKQGLALIGVCASARLCLWPPNVLTSAISCKFH